MTKRGLFGWLRPKPRDIAVLGLSKDEREYRQQRIEYFESVSDRPREEIVAIMDSWIISEGTQQIGEEEEEAIFIPHPLWDDEYPYTRHSYPTHELACAEVKARGAVMLEDLEL